MINVLQQVKFKQLRQVMNQLDCFKSKLGGRLTYLEYFYGNSVSVIRRINEIVDSHIYEKR